MGNLIDVFRDERQRIVSANTDLAATAEEYIRTKARLTAKTQERLDIIKKTRVVINSHEKYLDSYSRSHSQTINLLRCRSVYSDFDGDKVMGISTRMREQLIKDAEMFDNLAALAQQVKDIDGEIANLKTQVERLDSRMERLAN